MSVRRAACAVAVAALLGGCVVGSSVAHEGGKGGASKSGGAGGETKADRIALDEPGDADGGVDIQSLAVFNPTDLDFVGLSIAGRTLDISQARAVEVYLSTKPRAFKPQYRLVAFNEKPSKGVTRVRLYRVGDWDAPDSKRVTCKRLRVQFDIEQVGQIRIAMPRSCLGGARRSLRANATVWRQHSADWRVHPQAGKRADVVPDEKILTPDTH